MHDILTLRTLLAEKRGQETDAVHRFTRRIVGIEDVRRGRKQVGQAYQGLTLRASLHLALPGHQERNPVATIPQICLPSPQLAARVMTGRQKILEAHTNVKDLNLLEAKMNFIKAWQSLPDYGVSLFVVRFHGEKKDELLGVASNKIMRMTLGAGDHLKTWRFSTMKVRDNYNPLK